MSSNLPPGCSVNDIPGNRPEDMAWEEIDVWATERFAEAGLSLEEYQRAVMAGIAAVKAQRALLADEFKDAAAENCEACEQHAAREAAKEKPLPSWYVPSSAGEPDEGW